MSSYIATKYKGEIKRKFQLKLIKLTFGCKQHLIWLTKLHSFKDWLIVMQGWNVSCDVVQCNKDSCRLYKAFWPAEQNIKHRRVHIQKYSFQLIFAGCLNMKISQFKEICSQHFQCRQLHYGFCPFVKLTFKDLAKLTALAAIFKTKSYFRWDIWGSLFIQFHFFHIFDSPFTFS